MKETITKLSVLSLILLSLTAIILCDCTTATEATAWDGADSVFYMPAEFEEQEAVWLGWQAYPPYYAVGAAMVKALKPYVVIKIVSETDSMRQVCKNYLLNEKIDTTGISFFVMPNNEFWIIGVRGKFLKKGSGAIASPAFFMVDLVTTQNLP